MEIMFIFLFIAQIFTIYFMISLFYKHFKYYWIETSHIFWTFYSTFMMNALLFLITNEFSFFIILTLILTIYFFFKKNEISFPIKIQDQKIEEIIVNQIKQIKLIDNKKVALKLLKEQIIFLSENNNLDPKIHQKINNIIES